ncbi:penicillin-binding protein 2 [Reinekea forsetii]|nr:penicillin-binding protein 2 [Reinekea forsetii]
MSAFTPLNNKAFEKRLFHRRMSVAFVIVSITLLLLLSRFFFLQILDYEKYESLSDRNRLEVLPIAPIRGLIYDRNGELLAKNLPSHTLSIVIERTKDIDSLIERLKELVELSDDQVDRFYKRLKQSRRPFDPVPLKIKLTEQEIAVLAAERFFLEGVQVEAELIRQYPEADAFAHVIGYVGRINEAELENLDLGAYAGIRFIGKQGVERQYEKQLLGQAGYQRVETNARGRIINVIEKKAPVPGANIHLHLDRQLQLYAYELLEGKKGAIVAIEPETGGILAMVSRPSYDPNLYVSGFPAVLYNALRDSPDKPFLNRTIRGQYPPASTIKPFIGLAGINEGVVRWDTVYKSTGSFQLPNDERLYRDWKRGGHGLVDMKDAIAESVDTYFYDMAYKLTLEPIHDMLAQFGFGQDTSLDLYNPFNGINPTREWKKNRHGFSWYAGDTVNLGIGQGYMLVTPMQLAIATAVLAEKGQWMMPRLILHSNDESLMDFPDKALPDVKLNNDAHWDKMNEALMEVMYGAKGTARGAGYQSAYSIAGKSGTAQLAHIQRDENGEALGDVPEHLIDHALFMGFAPVEDPKIAIAVVVENGGGGSSVAAPMMRKLMDDYLLRESTYAE